MTMQNVEKLTGRDLVALQEAGIIKRHESRRSIGMPPFDDGFSCPQCNHQIVPATPEEQLTLLKAPPEFEERVNRITATKDGVVVTETDTAGLPWEDPAPRTQPGEPEVPFDGDKESVAAGVAETTDG